MSSSDDSFNNFDNKFSDFNVGQNIIDSLTANVSDIGHEELGIKWNRIKKKLKTNLGDEAFNNWFNGIKVENVNGAVLTISLPTKFLASWLKSNYQELLLGYWKEEVEQVKILDFKTRLLGGAYTSKKVKKSKDEAPISSSQSSLYATTKDSIQPQWKNIMCGSNDNILNDKFTFEGYVTDSSNELVYTAAKQVAMRSFHSPIDFNPLYIHSSVGLGKTHLLQSISNEVSKNAPHRKTLYLSAERFMYSFVSAIKDGDMIQFKGFFRNVDILLIDDIQFLQGATVQRELCHSINALIDARRQVVVASDASPNELTTLNERLKSRFMGGLVAKIGTPNYDLRLSILRKKASELGSGQHNITFPDEILKFLANAVHGSGRELEGVLNRLLATYDLTRQPITLEMASKSVQDLVRKNKFGPVMIDDIHRAVAEHFKISKNDLLSRRRHHSVVRPRQIAMYLAKELTARSLPEIGRRFGNRDHTTVLYAVRKIHELMKKDDNISNTVDSLRNILSM